MQREAKERKRVLLVAGTGTLGGPTYAELARLGHSVDVISLEDFKSVTTRLSFLKADASTDRMERFLDGRMHISVRAGHVDVGTSTREVQVGSSRVPVCGVLPVAWEPSALQRRPAAD